MILYDIKQFILFHLKILKVSLKSLKRIFKNIRIITLFIKNTIFLYINHFREEVCHNNNVNLVYFFKISFVFNRIHSIIVFIYR